MLISGRTIKKLLVGEAGIAFLETLTALALLGIISVAFLSGLATTSRSTMIADEQTTAENLAKNQFEWVKGIAYTENATGYTASEIPGNDDYIGYSAVIAAQPLHMPDDGIQKITVTVYRYGDEKISLEGYKVNR